MLAFICFSPRIVVVALSRSFISMNTPKIIDSHFHIWASEDEAKSFYPYAAGQTPPQSLRNAATTEKLIDTINAAGVDGALIVQPINHKFDHSYVSEAIRQHPDKFKGMLLHDPSMPKHQAVKTLEDLLLLGFGGVRFNPYLWPKGLDMSSDEAALAVFHRCAQLNMPVGIMCFQGLHLHYNDILALITSCPDTTCIIDHFGFTALNPQGDENFVLLLQLAKFPNVVVKISALFRIDQSNEAIRIQRFEPLLSAFGADRLMFGSDFPFVTETRDDYIGAVQIVSEWCNPAARRAVMGGTAQRLFGAWCGGQELS